jgi:hypothetical protein
VAEIQYRAEIRMGELSQDLDAIRERDEQGRLLPTSGKQAKGDTLRAAGVSTSTAHRYESLAGDPRARAEAARATDAYFAETRAKKERPTVGAEGAFALRTSPRPTG